MKEKPFSEMIDTMTDDDGLSVRHAAWKSFRANHVVPSRHPSHIPIALSAAEALPIKAAAKECALCGFVFQEEKQKHFDHDHNTGRFRGIICFVCNVTLGWFEKFLRNPALRTRIVQYLKGDNHGRRTRGTRPDVL
jgi:hypothetical protein